MTQPVAIVYSPPPEHLADRISSFYDFTNPAPLHDDVERADRQQLRVVLSGQGHYHFANGHVDDSPRVSLTGPTSGSIRGISEGPIHIVGAGLLPAAWHQLVGQDAATYLDRCIDARLVFGDSVDDLWAEVAAAPDPGARFAIIGAFIANATTPADAAHVRFIQLVDAWLTENADPEVQALSAATGLSSRSLERMTKRYYGLPPKTLARKYRALRAAAALARGEALEAIGMEHSFYDQSHLTRELKRFAGLTPQQIKDRHSQLTTTIALGRVEMRGQVSRLISEA